MQYADLTGSGARCRCRAVLQLGTEAERGDGEFPSQRHGATHAPGAAIAVVQGGRIVFAEGFHRLTAIRGPTRIAMLQPLPAHLAIASPQALRLAITQLQYGSCIHQFQSPFRDSYHHLHSLQLMPLQQDLPGWRSQFKGTFLLRLDGPVEHHCA
jgi:hypothetical protein